MRIEKDKSLKKLNTFNIECKADRFAEVSTVKEIKNVLLTHSKDDLFILGGGSNLLLTQDIHALVLHINLKGISVVSESEDQIVLEVMAGENWHDFVQYCISKDLGGVENLSLIPGNVGTAPIQNIGAYGVEIKDVFLSCKAIEIHSLKEVVFLKDDCEFGYRNSIFKNKYKGKYIITSVSMKLTKQNHKLDTTYGAIKEILDSRGIKEPTIKNISDAVIEIRNSKLPDPKVLGNSGSFFKNPIIVEETFNRLYLKYPKMPFYEMASKKFKVPAGWLIEQSGFKGKRFGEAGVHKDQALVLVNHGGATGKDILALAKDIQKSVKEIFGIELEPEVNIF